MTQYPHGTIARYQAGCHETCCKRAKKLYAIERERAIDAGRPYQVSSERSVRKMRALVALGWSWQDIANIIGSSRTNVAAILGRDTIRATTAERFDRVYDGLEMKIPEDTIWVHRQKNVAARNGWLPPLAWEDIDAGILADQSPDRLDRQRLDEDVIEQVLQYHDFSMWMSPLEKAEVVRRWVANGRSEASLCRLTGWKEGRYRPANQEVSP